MNRISQHLRSNVVGYIALFVAMGGTAAALPGSNTVNSGDIIDNQVKATDVRDDSLTGGGLGASDLQAGSVASSEVLNDTDGGGLMSGDLQPDSVGSSEIAEGAVNGSEIGAVGTADVTDDNLTGTDISNAAGGSLAGADIDENSLAKVPNADTLDGWDANNFLMKSAFTFYRDASNPAGTVNEIIVNCNTGDFALAGGFDNGGNEVDVSEPNPTSNGWRVYTAWPTESMTAYVTCVNL